MKLSFLKNMVPVVNKTAENRMRGGFLAIGNANVSVHGGPNSRCGRNDVCSDNGNCYDNHDSQACSGNWQSSCFSLTSKPTVTSTITATAAAGFTIHSIF